MKESFSLFFQRKTHLQKTTFLLMCFFFLSLSAAVAQSKTITGTVVDDLKEPLIGVTVSVKNTTNGSLTDFDGNYSITAEVGQTLLFSYIGMNPKEIVVTATTQVLDVELDPDSQMLSETVVIGYGTAKKRDLTGSIVSVSADQLANRPSSNPLASLQGKISGVQVVNTGRAGQDPEIRIRGTNSINGYKPLYVVDGLFNDNINFLNPSDIESMEILKDPSSLAIFGVRGANGVIIISTKKAKEGQTMVNINSSVGFKKVVDKMDMVDAQGFKTLYNEQRAYEGLAPYDFSEWTADTDWQDEIFQTGFITDNNVSITGATDRAKFYAGVGYASEEGNIKHEKFSKVTVNLNSEYKVSDNLKVGFQFNGARMLPTDEKKVDNALRAAPISEPFNEKYGLYSALSDIQKAQLSNPMVDVELKKNTSRAINYKGGGNIYADLSFLRDFNFRTTFSLNYRSDDLRAYTPIIQVYDRYIKDGDPIDVLGTKRTAVRQEKVDETNVQSDFILSYNKTVNKDHSINATAGFTTFYSSMSKLEGKRDQGKGRPIPNDPDKWFVSMGDSDAATVESDQWTKTTASFLARVLYSYQNKYLFNASFRRDGSSAFTYTGNQWQNFYSFGGGWVMTEEEFMKNNSFLDYLKLKASWGTLGNQTVTSSYPGEPVFESKTSAIFGKNEYIYPALKAKYIPDANLRWEKIEAWETGLESYFLKNRLRFEGVFYKKNTKDLLGQVQGLAGTTPGLSNMGEMENRGFEFNLGWNDKINDDWSYGVSANLTTIRNRVIKLAGDGYRIIGKEKSVSYTEAGYPIGYFYGYKVDGVYQNQAEIDASEPNKLMAVVPGVLKFKDVNGDGIIDQNDRTIIGNPTPDFTYGFSVNLAYKNFDLSVDMMGVEGNEIFRTWDNYDYTQFNYMANRLGRWHGEGTSDTEPMLNKKYKAINAVNSDYFIEDGSFFRIRNIQLGYTFDRSLLKKLRMQALKVYVNAQNPITWKNNTGYTPEIGGDATEFGIDKGTYPMPAIYTLGVNLTF